MGYAEQEAEEPNLRRYIGELKAQLAAVTKERDEAKTQKALDLAETIIKNISDERNAALAKLDVTMVEMKKIRPKCEECGNPAVAKFDTNGEGCYWLCERTDRDHDEEHYIGTEVVRLNLAALDAKEGGG